MAVATKCQTPGATYHTHIDHDTVTVRVEFPVALFLTDEMAATLEANIHNALELVFAQYYPA